MSKGKSNFIPRSGRRPSPSTLRMRLLAGVPPAEIVLQTRMSDEPEAFLEALKWVHAQASRALSALPPEFPATLADLRPDSRIAGEMSAEREIAWACARLVPHVSKLTEFIHVFEAFGRARLREDFAECVTQLDGLQRNLGWSHWLIRSRIALLQAAHGLEAHKLWVADLGKSGITNVTGIILHYASLCNEPSQTPARIFTQLDSWIKAHGLSEGAEAYLRYVATRRVDGGSTSIAGILNLEGPSAIVDLYEALIAVGQNIAGGNKDMLRRSYLRWTEPLAQRVKDSRLDMIRVTLGASCDLPICHPATAEAFEALVRGQWRLAYELAVDALDDDPAQPDALEIAAWALASGGEGYSHPVRFVHRLIGRMASVMFRADGATDDAQELVRVSTAFAGLPWAEGVLGFTERETTADPIGEGPASVRAAAVTAPVHPLRVARLHLPATRTTYALAAAKLGPGAAFYVSGEGEGVLPEPAGVCHEMANLVELRRALWAGDFARALIAAELLSREKKAPYRQWGVRASAHCLLRLDRLHDALGVIVQYTVTDPPAHEILPVSEAAAALNRNARAALAGELAVPILFDLHSRHIGSNYDSERAYATEDLLEAHGVDRPSALGTLVERFDRRRLVYFLRHVCVETVLETLLSLNGSREVREERVEVCRLLIQLDPSDADTYKAEIKDLLRRLVVQRRMREVEQSKIHVDVDGIRRVADSTLRETYNRIAAFLQAGLDLSRLLQLQHVVRAALGESGYLVIGSPAGESGDLLTALVQQLRDLYVASPEYGLDKYLSVRIRHQTLAGHLRKPLEEQALITQLDKAANRYKQNLHWIGRLGLIGSEAGKVLDDAFERFAHEFDRLVAEIRDTWIQIRTEEEDHGLFDFVIDEVLVQRLAQSLTRETTFEQFVEAALSTLGAKLDANLSKVRDRLSEEATARLNGLFSDLAGAVETLAPRVYIAELAKAIRDAHTSMQYALQRVVEWFRRARSVANEPFDVEDAVHISQEIVRTGPNPFPLSEVRVEGEHVQLPGEMFNDYIDILTTIFGNVVTYAQQGAGGIEVKVWYQAERIRIRVENDVAPSYTDSFARERVIAIRSDIAGGQFRRVAREGGTGFYKIGKILDGLQTRGTLDFGFVAKSRFFVEFQTPATVGGR